MGWEFVEAIRESGREPDKEDLPPDLGWESPIWWLYLRVRTQWRTGMAGATGLDYGPAIDLIKSMGWPLRLALELLQAVETGFLAAWAAQGGG